MFAAAIYVQTFTKSYRPPTEPNVNLPQVGSMTRIVMHANCGQSPELNFEMRRVSVQYTNI